MSYRRYNERQRHQRQQHPLQQHRHQLQRQSESPQDPVRQLHQFEENARKLFISVPNEYYCPVPVKRESRCLNQETAKNQVPEKEATETLIVGADTVITVRDRHAALVRLDENTAPLLIVIARDADVAAAVNPRAVEMSHADKVKREIAALHALLTSARSGSIASSHGALLGSRLE